MNIQQVLRMPAKQKFGGFDVSIKTCKKKWELNGKWMQQITISDSTGDALADVNIEKNISLQRGSVLHITVGEVQEGVPEVGSEGFKKIYIDQFVIPSDIGEPELDYDGSFGEIRGKIRHGLVCADKSAGNVPDKADILYWTEFIMTGK